jgi:serine/threonine-protein kinase RsbW
MNAVIELTIPAKPEYLILTRLALSGLARTAPIDDELLADLKLAVTEACGNVVRHAYNGADAGVMSVRYLVDDRQIEITVEDSGAGVRTPTAIPDLDADELPMESGMGVPIMRATMDHVSVRSGSGGTGTLVTMRKRLGRPASDVGTRDAPGS